MVELFKDMPPEVEDQFDVKKFPLNPLMKLLFHFIQVRLRMFEPDHFEWQYVTASNMHPVTLLKSQCIHKPYIVHIVYTV